MNRPVFQVNDTDRRPLFLCYLLIDFPRQLPDLLPGITGIRVILNVFASHFQGHVEMARKIFLDGFRHVRRICWSASQTGMTRIAAALKNVLENTFIFESYHNRNCRRAGSV
jgi:hypothetical protein